MKISAKCVIFVYLFVYSFLRQSISVYPWLSWNLFCRPGWPQTQRSSWLFLPSVGILILVPPPSVKTPLCFYFGLLSISFSISIIISVWVFFSNYFLNSISTFGLIFFLFIQLFTSVLLKYIHIYFELFK